MKQGIYEKELFSPSLEHAHLDKTITPLEGYD